VLDPLDVVRFIESESNDAAATIAVASLDVRVPSCPDWSFADLIWHLGRVQRFWASVIRAGSDGEPEFPPEAQGPSEAGELEAWFRTSTTELLAALDETPWDTPAWTWWIEERTVAAIARHQVQEAAVHRWDAQQAVARLEPLPALLADDGVDEFLWVARQMRGPVPIAFDAIDTGTTFSAGPGAAAATVSATASDLVLLLYGRVEVGDVEIVGDRAAVAEFLVPIG
jgi:uncharacterized protein (TIGR03083 family)